MIYGILAIVTASILFGITPTGNKYALLSGMNEECLLFYQSLTMTIVSAFIIRVKKQSGRIPAADAIKLMLLGAVGIGGTDYLLNLAYGSLSVSTVVMLHFMYPTVVLVIMFLFFHQKPSFFTLCAVLLSITGLFLVTDQQGGTSAVGIFFALSSAASYALFAIANDRWEINRIPLIVKLFYMSLSTALIYGTKTLLDGTFSTPADWTVALIIFGVVGIGSLIGFYLITYGIRHIGASRAAFLNMLEPMAGVIIGVLVFQEAFVFRAKIGCVCVLLSVLLIAFDGITQGK